MRRCVLTMSRGDASRIEEWVKYHAGLGFNEFRIILDNPIDDTEHILNGLDVNAEVHIDVRGHHGTYFDGMDQAERWETIKRWRIENAEAIAAIGMGPVADPISHRQRQYFVPELQKFSDAGDGWLALIDVDEFIVLPPHETIADVIAAAIKPRLRFLNFNVDMRDWRPGQSVLEQNMRWHRDDLVAYGKGWDTRVKTVARHDALMPMDSVHRISPGPNVMLDPDHYRLLHYRGADQGIAELPYRVVDDAALQRFSHGA